MQNSEVYSLLGLATRARKTTTGEAVLQSIKTKTASLVIIANDASENTKKKLTDKCTFYQIEYVFYGDIDSLSHAIGKHNRVSVAVNDKGFAIKIKSKLGG